VKDGTDGEAIKKATEELSAEMSKIGEAMAKAGATRSLPKLPKSKIRKSKDAEFKEKGPEGETPKA